MEQWNDVTGSNGEPEVGFWNNVTGSGEEPEVGVGNDVTGSGGGKPEVVF